MSARGWPGGIWWLHGVDEAGGEGGYQLGLRQRSNRDWVVLLIGGHSATGKTSVSEHIGWSFGVPWMMVDDLRLAFQRARATLPEGTEALYFDTVSDYWNREPEEQRDGLIAVGEALSPSLEAVIENHVDQSQPIVIEGDGILPSLLSRPSVLERKKAIRTAFLVEPDEPEILRNVLARSRGVLGRSQQVLHNQARSSWLFGQWIGEEAALYDLPIVEPRPWETLQERVLAVIGS